MGNNDQIGRCKVSKEKVEGSIRRQEESEPRIDASGGKSVQQVGGREAEHEEADDHTVEREWSREALIEGSDAAAGEEAVMITQQHARIADRTVVSSETQDRRKTLLTACNKTCSLKAFNKIVVREVGSRIFP